MNNEKIENLLNLALDATEREREKSLELNVGYDEEERTWEVIVKYGGTTEQLLELLQKKFPEQYGKIKLTDLQNEYAILLLPESIVQAVATLNEIEYMEKPKNLFFAVDSGRRSSCITPLQIGDRKKLTGEGCIVAVIDSGIDYAHPDFRNPDGTTRILSLWDQTIPGESVPDKAAEGKEGAENGVRLLTSPSGYFMGTEFSRETIDFALEQPTEIKRFAVCPSRDSSGHGTHVAGIAAGNGRASEGKYKGVAYESDLLIVKLGTPKDGEFARTSELMQAVDYCFKKAQEYKKPLALNLSFGNNYGSHSGTSLIETYLDHMANQWKNVIVIGSGNEGGAAVHTSGTVTMGRATEVEIVVSEYESMLNLQIWKSYVDEMAVSMVHPNGMVIGPIRSVQGTQRFVAGNTQILLYYGEPSPYSPYQEIFFDFLPISDYVDAGIWEIRLVPQRIVLGHYDMWLPVGGVLNAGTGFLYPIEETTLTIPSTATKVITVGAYDARFSQPVAFSGRGYTRATRQIKPDIAAPGVDIVSCAPGGGYTARTGTSMATPFVTGAAALMMEWGIVKENDPYLYGEKIKAYLIRGARHLPGLVEYPNPQLGWGALCVKNSFPE